MHFAVIGILSQAEICISTNKQEEIDEDDNKLLEAFLSKDARPQRTLADLIVDKIKEKDSLVSSGFCCFFVVCYIVMLRILVHL